MNIDKSNRLLECRGKRYCPRDKECKIMDFQHESISYALEKKRTFIADSMGTGKTISALVTIDTAKVYPVIIVCPASLKRNWSYEILHWLDALETDIYTISGKDSRNKTKLKALQKAKFIIINYDILSAWTTELLKLNAKSLINDECHALKHKSSARSKAAKKLASNPYTRYILNLSGTPITNKPSDLINQLDILNRLNDLGGWQKFVLHYCKAYKKQVTRDRWVWDVSGASNLGELNSELRRACLIRHEKADVLKELPDKQHTIILVEPDNLKEYKLAEEDIIAFVQENAAKNKQFLEEINHLPEYIQEQAIFEQTQEVIERTKRGEALAQIEILRQLAVKGKIAQAKEWIDNFLESGEKLLVFADHIEIQKLLLEIYPDAAHILGEDDLVTRDINVQRIQTDPDCNTGILSIKAAGVGLTLTSFNNALFIEHTWSPSEIEQACDRLHRYSQLKKVNIYHILAENTIDWTIFKLLKKKQSIISQAMGIGNVEFENISIENELLKSLVNINMVV